jgi:hypothetical protein
VIKYGHSLCNDSLSCEGLLRDYCGNYHREIFVLVCALKEQVPSDLMATRDTMPYDLVQIRLTKRICRNCALTKNAATWAVESWALALGIITYNDIKKNSIKKQKRNSKRTHKNSCQSSNREKAKLESIKGIKSRISNFITNLFKRMKKLKT